MKHITLFVILLFSNLLWAQKEISTTTQINVDITAIDLASAKSSLKTFISENNAEIKTQNETKNSINLTLNLNDQQYQKLRVALPNWGYVSSDIINTIDHQEELEEVSLEIEFLKKKKTNYEEVMSQHEMKSAQFESLWREKQNIEDRIFNLEKRRSALQLNQLPYTVDITIEEEMTMPENSKVTFVNMPGVEYSYLKIENPVDTITASAYQGYFIKYLFTRGKSYAGVGAYKSIEKLPGDSTYFSELFVMNFGQDFYSRHLGRGENKFGNLYSGYTLGYMAASNEVKKEDIFYLSPSIGVELFKNKYFLWDTKVNYFIPFSYNRNMRGIGFNTSLNFVF
ncbi:MAG: hypothetical protein RL106_1181 [Bacteroidota bacterium]|jgi:hypothetical protein